MCPVLNSQAQPLTPSSCVELRRAGFGWLLVGFWRVLLKASCHMPTVRSGVTSWYPGKLPLVNLLSIWLMIFACQCGACISRTCRALESCFWCKPAVPEGRKQSGAFCEVLGGRPIQALVPLVGQTKCFEVTGPYLSIQRQGMELQRLAGLPEFLPQTSRSSSQGSQN